MPTAGTHATGLPTEPNRAAGKLITSGATDRPPEGEHSEVQTPESTIYTLPVSPSSGFRLSGLVNGVGISLLVDTGAAVTLLRLDAWEQVVAQDPVSLEPWPTVRLLGAGGVPLTVHGCAKVILGLGSEVPH